MGGGRDKSGASIYKRVSGRYVRVRPYANDIKRIQNAKTHDELKEVLDYLGLWNGYGYIYVDDIPNLETAKEMTVGMYEMFQRYGYDGMHPFRVSDPVEFRDGEYGHSDAYSGSGDVAINSKYYGGESRTDYSDDVGYHPKGMSDKMLIQHEYAHVLQTRLADNYKEPEGYYESQRQKYNEMKNSQMFKLWDEYQKLHEERMSKTADITQLRPILKRMSDIRMTDGYLMFSAEFERMQNYFTQRQTTRYKSNAQIRELFTKIGYSAPFKVAKELTGDVTAYASKNWAEAHAECVADFMTNGKNASPVSIKYVREMEKLIGVKEY